MSSTKRIVKITKVIDAEDISAGVISDVIEADALDLLAVEAAWSGTSPIGSLVIEGSITGNVWVTLGSALSVTGSPGSGIGFGNTIGGNALAGNPFTKVRVRYIRSSGDGTLNAWLCAKEF